MFIKFFIDIINTNNIIQVSKINEKDKKGVLIVLNKNAGDGRFSVYNFETDEARNKAFDSLEAILNVANIEGGEHIDSVTSANETYDADEINVESLTEIIQEFRSSRY